MSMFAAALALPLFCHQINVPVSEDSSVIQQSLAIPNAADQNFGASEELAIGTYHITAEGLIKFSLKGLKAEKIEQVEIVITSPRVVGSFPSLFTLTKTASDWSESTVTWNTKPADESVVGDISIGTEDVSYDLTDLVLAALSQQEEDLSLKIASKSSASLFLPSKEKNPEQAAIYLKVKN